MDSLQLDMSEFLDAFFEEADEHLRALEEGFLRLEQTPTDSEVLNSVFRSAHTIKGTSGMVGLGNVVRYTHTLETLLDKMRSGEITATDDLISLLLASSDGLSALIQAAQQGSGTPEGTDELLVRLEAALHSPAPSLPQDLRRSGAELSAALLPGIGEADADDEQSTERGERESHDPARSTSEARGGGAATAANPAKSNESIRVSIEKMENLINLAGELVIANSMVNQLTTRLDAEDKRFFDETLADLNRTTRQLQEQIMALRLVPIGSTFRRFPRLVRDLAGTLGKRIRLELYGEETELDRQMVEEISDPLTHLIRNSIDHGVESTAERLAVGKPAEGLVQLRAFHEGGSVIIEVEDDGRGLNTAKIRAKAIERGLIQAEENHSDEQLHELIFHAGFSTADQITDVSGRGVGMDVVRRNIEQLKGSVNVRSVPGRGCVFRVKLPLTMAIMDGLTVALGDVLLIIPLLSVVESIRPAAEHLKTVAGKGEVIMIRRQPVPLIRLHQQFNLPARCTNPAEALVVLVECQQKLLALLVDDLLGQQQVVMKNMETNYGRVEGIAGATILGDGRVAFILDVGGVLRLAQIN